LNTCSRFSDLEKEMDEWKEEECGKLKANEVRVVRGRVGEGRRDLEPRRDSVTDKRDCDG
jgi:hypothetical protein